MRYISDGLSGYLFPRPGMQELRYAYTSPNFSSENNPAQLLREFTSAWGVKSMPCITAGVGTQPVTPVLFPAKTRDKFPREDARHFGAQADMGNVEKQPVVGGAERNNAPGAGDLDNFSGKVKVILQKNFVLRFSANLQSHGTRDETLSTRTRRRSMTKSAVTVLSASSITGDKVENSQGDNLGHIEDLMIDLTSGRVAYAVLSFGGVLGLGDKLFAIPMEALAVKPEEKCFILNVSKEKLENAPGFDKDHWPDMADRKWADSVYKHYGYRPHWDQ